MTNNKQQTEMKLYTEKDLIKAIAFGFGICHKEDRAPFNKEMIEFIASLEPTTPIELPSDEEIWDKADEELSSVRHYAFMRGAKWMRDKKQFSMTNNKQQTAVKLYTEEQVLRGIVLARLHEYSHSQEELLGLLTPLELPSDEEIKESMGHYDESDTDDEAFLAGAKWMRDKIQGGEQ
jgi:hypothetical protein